jgi:hypothetical protein
MLIALSGARDGSDLGDIRFTTALVSSVPFSFSRLCQPRSDTRCDRVLKLLIDYEHHRRGLQALSVLHHGFGACTDVDRIAAAENDRGRNGFETLRVLRAAGPVTIRCALAAAATLRTLTIVTLEPQYGIDIGAHLLVELLPQCVALRRLGVHGGSLTETEVAAVLGALGSSGVLLRHLDIGRNGAYLGGETTPLARYAAALPPRCTLVLTGEQYVGVEGTAALRQAGRDRGVITERDEGA